jgi:hypothetical protein
VGGFIDYLTNERHFSAYTARCYGADLRQFVDRDLICLVRFGANAFGVMVESQRQAQTNDGPQCDQGDFPGHRPSKSRSEWQRCAGA